MIDAPPPAPGPIGVYLHFPFCAVRCTYCDFTTVAGRDGRIGTYLEALEREILHGQPDLGGPVDTVFLGGGTPSRLLPEQLDRLLALLRSRFDLAPDAEITLECNPESAGGAKLRGFRDAGATRVSIGVQSLDDEVLGRAGRAHDGRCALEAVDRALETSGLEVNADLIAGLPGEDLARWSETVSRVAARGTDHLSVYLLETDKQTPLARAVASGRVAVADDDAMAAAYEETVSALAAGGMELYEISNFARAGRVSRHNLKYWTDHWYAGFGLGAHGYGRGRRRANVDELDRYLDLVERGVDPVADEDEWDPARRLEEALILGLRLARGVDTGELGRRYGIDLDERFAAAWDRAEQAGLTVREGRRVRLTASGRLRCNELFAEILGG